MFIVHPILKKFNFFFDYFDLALNHKTLKLYPFIIFLKIHNKYVINLFCNQISMLKKFDAPVADSFIQYDVIRWEQFLAVMSSCYR